MDIDIILEADLTAQQIKELGLMAEKYGFRAIWTQNYAKARDAFMTAVPLALASKKIMVGVCIVSPYEMHPLKIANATLTLNECAKGRGCVTIGGGGEWMMMLGFDTSKRVSATREALEIIQGAIREDTFNYNGKLYKARWFNSDWTTDQPPLIYAGASGPKMLSMSSGVADGVMMGDIAPVMFDWPLPTLNKALADNSRTDDNFRISNFLAWHIKEDREFAIQEARREMIVRGWLERPWLEPFLSPEDTQFVLDNKWPFIDAYRKRSSHIEGIPEHILEALVEGLGCTGDPSDLDRYIEKLNKYSEAGFTEVALRIHDDPDYSIKLIGELVLPKLH